jgi:hypothetical protein
MDECIVGSTTGGRFDDLKSTISQLSQIVRAARLTTDQLIAKKVNGINIK